MWQFSRHYAAPDGWQEAARFERFSSMCTQLYGAGRVGRPGRRRGAWRTLGRTEGEERRRRQPRVWRTQNGGKTDPRFLRLSLGRRPFQSVDRSIARGPPSPGIERLDWKSQHGLAVSEVSRCERIIPLYLSMRPFGNFVNAPIPKNARILIGTFYPG